MRQIHKVHVLHILKTRASIQVSFLEQGHYFSLLAALHLSPSWVGIPGHLLINVTSLLVAAAQENWEISILSFIKKHLLSLTSKISSWFVRSKRVPVITLPTFNGSYGKEVFWNAGNPGSIPVLKIYPREGNGYPVHYSCLKNCMDRSLVYYSLWGL